MKYIDVYKQIKTAAEALADPSTNGKQLTRKQQKALRNLLGDMMLL